MLKTHALLSSQAYHRDIKPSNIVLEGGKAGGRVFLVDFGGVQAAALQAADGAMGSTIIGTYGYMVRVLSVSMYAMYG